MKMYLKLIILMCCMVSSLSAKISITDEEISKLSKTEIQTLLEENNYNPLQSSNSGNTILHLAVKKNDFAALKLGILFGIDLRITNKAQDSPLHLAAEKGNLEMVKFLMENGSSSLWINQLGQSPYHKALQNNHEEIISFFIEQGYQPGDKATDTLIALGYNPSSKDKSGNTVIHKAAAANDLTVLEILIEQGWNLDSRNKSGKNALMLAASKGLFESVESLLAHGTDVNARDNKGDTALIIAIKAQQDFIVSLLLEQKSINLNITNEKGIAALHYAVAKGNLYSTQLLLQKGAAVNIETQPQSWSEADNWTRLDWEAWAECSTFQSIRSGYHTPKVTALAIADLLHPGNIALKTLLNEYKATHVHVPATCQHSYQTPISLETYLK